MSGDEARRRLRESVSVEELLQSDARLDCDLDKFLHVHVYRPLCALLGPMLSGTKLDEKTEGANLASVLFPTRPPQRLGKRPVNP